MKKIDEIKKMIDLVRNINESLESNKNLLVEKNPLGTVAREGAITAKMLEPILKDLMVGGRKEATLLTSIGVKNSDDLLKVIKNDFKFLDTKLGTLSAKEASSLRGGLELSILKNPSGISKELMGVAASNLVKDSRFLEKYKAYANEPDLVNVLKTNGYSDQAAKELAKLRFSQLKIKPIPNTTPKPINPGAPIPPITVPKWWKFEWAKDKKWLKRALVIAGVGAGLTAIYLAWKTFFGDDDDLPPCAKLLVTNEVEFEKYLENGYITMGKYTIYQNKNIKIILSTGKEIIGKWSYNTETETIVADFNGRIVNVPCAEGTENPEPEKNPISQKSKYVVCTGFPYNLYCKNEDIRNVQKCLGGVKPDSYLGPKTEAKLNESGYSLPLTKEVYDKIIANCGGSQQSLKTTKNPLDGEQSLDIENGEVASLTPEENPES